MALREKPTKSFAACTFIHAFMCRFSLLQLQLSHTTEKYLSSSIDILDNSLRVCVTSTYIHLLNVSASLCVVKTALILSACTQTLLLAHVKYQLLLEDQLFFWNHFRLRNFAAPVARVRSIGRGKKGPHRGVGFGMRDAALDRGVRGTRGLQTLPKALSQIINRDFSYASYVISLEADSLWF